MILWDKLKSFGALYEKFTEPVREQYNLTQMEFDILMFLHNNPQYNTANDIVKVRRLTKSHVSVSVSSLEKKGLLERHSFSDNRKSIILKLTPATEKIISAGTAVQSEYGDVLIRGFSDSEINAFRKLFLRTYENVNDELNRR